MRAREMGDARPGAQPEDPRHLRCARCWSTGSAIDAGRPTSSAERPADAPAEADLVLARVLRSRRRHDERLDVAGDGRASALAARLAPSDRARRRGLALIAVERREATRPRGCTARSSRRGATRALRPLTVDVCWDCSLSLRAGRRRPWLTSKTGSRSAIARATAPSTPGRRGTTPRRCSRDGDRATVSERPSARTTALAPRASSDCAR